MQSDLLNKVYYGDNRVVLPQLIERGIRCNAIITSPPYLGLRSYLDNDDENKDLEIGNEQTVDEYINNLVAIFSLCRELLYDDGTLWVVISDSYAGSGGQGGQSAGKQPKYGGVKAHGDIKSKDLCLVPSELAIAVRKAGWWVRCDVIWNKPSCLPPFAPDRPLRSHEYVWMFSKTANPYYDQDAERGNINYRDKIATKQHKKGEPHSGKQSAISGGANPSGSCLRSVWSINPEPLYGVKSVHPVRVEQGAVLCGMSHKVSPNCPVHGYLCRQGSILLNDERKDDDHFHKEHSDNHRVEEQSSCCVPIVKSHDENLPLSSSDSPVQRCDFVATDHNNQNHKKALDLETNSPCISSEEKSCRTDDKLTQPSSVAPHPDTDDHNILQDDKGAHSQDQIVCRIVDKSSLPIPSSCLCSFYQQQTKLSNHFAAFPSKLASRLIRLATSEHGHCPQCGRGFKRVIEKGEPDEEHQRLCGADSAGEYHGESQKDYLTAKAQDASATKTRILRSLVTKRTISWEPECECGLDPVPAIILDPFMGSGTVAQIAESLNRRWIGCELNETDYKPLIEKRTAVGHEKGRQEKLFT